MRINKGSNGICLVHFVEYKVEESDCNTCDGEGLLEREEELTGEILFVKCHECLGKGSQEYPRCDLCEEDYINDQNELDEAIRLHETK